MHPPNAFARCIVETKARLAPVSPYQKTTLGPLNYRSRFAVLADGVGLG